MPKLRGGLYRNEGGRFWLYEYRWKGVKHKGTTGCDREAAARTWLKLFRERQALAGVGLVQRDPVTLHKLHTLWTEECGGHLASTTLAITELRLRLHLAELVNLPCTEITAELVGRARARYLAGADPARHLRRSPGGANKLVATLRDLLGWGVRRGYLKALPFKLEKLGVQQKVPAIVWPEQVPAFLEAVRKGEKSPDASLSVLLQLVLGLRENEALGARWEWLDLRRGVYQVGRAKNRKVREISCPTPLLAHLMALHEAKGHPTHGLILPAEDGLPRRAQYSKKPLTRAAKVLGIIGLTPHRLRATFATTHFEAGTEISQIQQMMGHKHPSTTMGYILMRPKGQAEAQDRVSKLMGLEGAVPVKSPTKTPKPRKSNNKVA